MTTLLITGASRGIGLEHVRQALAAGDQVIAAARNLNPDDALHALLSEHPTERLRIESLDVADPVSIEALAHRLDGLAIDVLLNNAGIYGRSSAPAWPDGAEAQTLAGMDYGLWDDMHRVNVMGPFRLTAELLPNLIASQRKLVVMMSSDLGSITNNLQGSSHAYRSSKAALNMLTRGLAMELKAQNVSVVSLAPGWTKTDLGGDGATWSVTESVESQRRVLETLGPGHSGRFFDLLGREVAW